MTEGRKTFLPSIILPSVILPLVVLYRWSFSTFNHSTFASAWYSWCLTTHKHKNIIKLKFVEVRKSNFDNRGSAIFCSSHFRNVFDCNNPEVWTKILHAQLWIHFHNI
jgi:hypothetical protein